MVLLCNFVQSVYFDAFLWLIYNPISSNNVAGLVRIIVTCKLATAIRRGYCMIVLHLISILTGEIDTFLEDDTRVRYSMHSLISKSQKGSTEALNFCIITSQITS